MNRCSYFGAMATALAMLFAGCSSVPSVSVAANPDAAGCAIVKEFPVCDADIRRRFAEISPTDKLLFADFDNWGEPVTLTATYTPELAGSHTVKTKIVVCTEYGEGQSFGCQMTRPTGYYDSDPELYILAGDNVDPAIAEKVVHLWMQGKLIAEQMDWLHALRPKDSRLYTLNYALHGVYTLDLHSSGCGGPISIRIEGEGDGERLRIIKPPEVICV